MKSDLKINYSKINQIRTALDTYRKALDTMQDALNNINNKLETENSGDAVTALIGRHEELQSDIDTCKEELDDLFNIFNGFHDEMTSIIKPESYGFTVRVDRTDIWWNMKTIFGCIKTIGKFRSQGDLFVESTPSYGYQSTFGPTDSSTESDKEKKNQEENYRKLEELWDIMSTYIRQLEDEKDRMTDLFNNKIVPYEEKDNEYGSKAKTLYVKNTTAWERAKDLVSNNIKDTWDFVVGAANFLGGAAVSIAESPGEVIAYFAGGAGCLISKFTGDTPECLDYAESKFDDTNQYMKDWGKNPYKPLEDIAQQASDTYEEKGPAYSLGSVAGAVALVFAPSPIKGKIGEFIKSNKKVTSIETSYVKSIDFSKLGTGNVGDFSSLKGTSIDDILSRIPNNATKRELTPIQGKVQEGFEYKFVKNGETIRVRVHGPDPSAPIGSNAYDNWIVRVQKGKKYMDSSGAFHPPGISNPNSEFFDESIIDDTHIPIIAPK